MSDRPTGRWHRPAHEAGQKRPQALHLPRPLFYGGRPRTVVESQVQSSPRPSTRFIPRQCAQMDRPPRRSVQADHPPQGPRACRNRAGLRRPLVDGRNRRRRLPTFSLTPPEAPAGPAHQSASGCPRTSLRLGSPPFRRQRCKTSRTASMRSVPHRAGLSSDVPTIFFITSSPSAVAWPPQIGRRPWREPWQSAPG